MEAFVLPVQPIPKPLWGKSLANLLPEQVWQGVRGRTFIAAEHRCEVCGYQKGIRLDDEYIGRYDDLDCDEVWEYDDAKGIARLVSTRGLCRMCHRVKHILRFSQYSSDDELRKVRDHALMVNRCDKSVFNAHVEQAAQVWEERSKRKWTIDWGEYAALFRE